MRFLVAALCLTAAAFISTARAQVGVKGMVEHQIDNAVEEHNQAVRNALSGADDANNRQVVQPGQIRTGWLTRRSADGKKDVRLYFAYPAALERTHPTAGLLVLQERWGVNDDLQQRTQDFAKHGFYAVAPDFYAGQVTDDPTRAAQLKASLTEPDAMTAMKTGLDLFDEEARNGVIDSNRVGVIGWDLGGQQALLLAIADARIHATAIYYGSLITDARRLSNLQGPVLGVFASADTAPSRDEVNKFDAAMKSAGKIDFRIHRYEGVGHAFASKSWAKTGQYNPEQANLAWQETYDWLDQKLLHKK